MKSLKLGALGMILVLVAIICFLTVADDFRHKGELTAVGSILILGLILVALSSRLSRREKGELKS